TRWRSSCAASSCRRPRPSATRNTLAGCANCASASACRIISSSPNGSKPRSRCSTACVRRWSSRPSRPRHGTRNCAGWRKRWPRSDRAVQEQEAALAAARQQTAAEETTLAHEHPLSADLETELRQTRARLTELNGRVAALAEAAAHAAEELHGVSVQCDGQR